MNIPFGLSSRDKSLERQFNNVLKNCLISVKLPNEGTDELSEDGFDWIALKVVLQIPKGLEKGPEKVKFGLFCYFWPIFSKAVI